MRAEFLPEAEREFREAARYYETNAPGVGLAFISDVSLSNLPSGTHVISTLRILCLTLKS